MKLMTCRIGFEASWLGAQVEVNGETLVVNLASLAEEKVNTYQTICWISFHNHPVHYSWQKNL